MNGYSVSDKYCLIIEEGAFDTFYDSFDEAVEAAVNFCKMNCNHLGHSFNEEYVRCVLKSDGYIDESEYGYVCIKNAVSWKRELAVDCYLYLDMLPGETEQEAYDRMVGLLNTDIEINLGHKEVRIIDY